MESKVISIYCFVDDILKELKHPEDVRRRVSDAEVITTAIVSAMYFYGHQHRAIAYMKSSRLIPQMLDKSRFTRRIHQIAHLLYELFGTIAKWIKEICCEMRYIIDSFPVAICDNMRIQRCKLATGKKWRGYTASMHRYFYGVKVQLLVTQKGVPIQFHFIPGKTADVKGLEKMLQHLHPEAEVYADSAYTDYSIEDKLKDEKGISLKVQRKHNSKRPDTKAQTKQKLKMRKRVETTISDIKKLFPRTIHAVTFRGFLLKLICFICVEQFNHFIN